MEDAKPIVKMLNALPLEFAISIADLCQKNSQELQQLLYEVLKAIHTPQRVDEAIEDRSTWMMELLRVLNYHRTGIDGKALREGIANGNADIIHPLLLWLVGQMPMLQKRAYLARFLVDVEIPAELMLHEDMNVLHAQFSCLREQFKATHRHLDTLRKSERDPHQIRDRLQELEIERDNLQNKILEVKSKLQDVDRADEMLDVVNQLKIEKEEEKKLAQTLEDQQQMLHHALDMRNKSTSKLHQLESQAAKARNDPTYVQEVLQDNEVLRDHVKERLPKEIAVKQKRLCAIQMVLSASDTADGLAGIQAKLVAANEEIRLRKTRQTEASKDENLQWQQEKMGVIIANKARVASDRLACLTACRDKLVKEIEQKHVAIDEVKAMVTRGEDLKQYVDLLRNKGLTYKRMKNEIDVMAAEYGCLLRTQQLLEQEHRSAHRDDCNDLDHEEKARSERIDLAARCKSTEILKSSISEAKTLVEERRSKVDLQYKELHDARKAFKEIDVEHVAKKQQCDSMQSLFERKVVKLEADICAIVKECNSESKAMQDNVAVIESLQAHVLQVNMEKQDSAVSQNLNAKVGQQQELMNSLQLKQQKLKEMQHSSASQKAMMKDLLTLLTAKLNSYSSGLKLPIFSTATSLDTADKIFQIACK